MAACDDPVTLTLNLAAGEQLGARAPRPFLHVWRSESVIESVIDEKGKSAANLSFPRLMLGCNNGGGGGNFSKVKQSVAKWIRTRKRSFSGCFASQVGF